MAAAQPVAGAQLTVRLRRRPALFGSPMATVGLALLAVLLLAGLLAPLIAPHAPNAQTDQALASPGLTAVMVTIATVNVPLFGRLTRTSVLSLRRSDFVVAAEVVGVPPHRVLLRHVLPNGVDPLIVQLALSLSMAVFIEGGMSFIGLGVLLPQPSLGNMLQASVNYLNSNPYYALGPMLVVILLVLGCQLVADGLTRKLLRR
jgi:peptide/nickel transport system permease protein